MRHDDMHRQMADRLRDSGADASFPSLHHFSNPKFAKQTPSLTRFCTYCDGIGDLRQNGENAQAIRRASAFVDKITQGSTADGAADAAWQQFPLVTR